MNQKIESQNQAQAIKEVEILFQTVYRKHRIELEFKKKVYGKEIKYKALVSPLHSTPNGGKKGWKVAKEHKAEGLLSGIEDMTLPIRNKKYTCLHMEMKIGKTSTTKKTYQKFNQKAWQKYHTEQGALSIVCYSVSDVVEAVKSYMETV